MKVTDVSFEQILWLVAFVVLMIGIYNTAMTAIKNHLDAKKRRDAPVDMLSEKVNAHARMLDNDKRRFEEIDRRFEEINQRLDDMDEGMGDMNDKVSMTLRGVRSLMSHSISGNSIDKLKENAAQIDDYLIEKAGGK